MLNHYATPPDTPGITRHYDFARELIKKGHSVSIFAAGFNHRTRKEERLKKGQNYRRQNINGVEFLWLRTSPYYGGNDWRRVVNMLSYSFRVIPVGLRYKEKPDVILASSPHPFAGLAGWLLAKFKRASFIFEVRDLWPENFIGIQGYSNNSSLIRLLRPLLKFLYQRAQKIVVIPPKASDHITRLGIPSNKTVHIPNGISPELFSNADTQLPEDLKELVSKLKSQDKLLVGYTGAHGPADDLGTLVETARLLKDKGISKIHFLLVGDGAEKKRLLEMATGFRLDNISFVNPIPKRTIPELLRAIDITAFPLRKSPIRKYGTSKNKLFDYMASTKPVVRCTDSTNDPVAEANCGITVPLEDAEAMAEAIKKLCDMSDKERRAMGKRGYEYVMKHHSVPILAQKLLEVMEEATGGSDKVDVT